MPHNCSLLVPFHASVTQTNWKMSHEQNSLESLFRRCEKTMKLLNGYRLTAKIKLHSKEKYQACHPSYGFIATGGIICRDRLANEVVKHPKLLWKIETKHSTLKDKPLEFFEKRKCDQRRKKNSYWGLRLSQMCLHWRLILSRGLHCWSKDAQVLLRKNWFLVLPRTFCGPRIPPHATMSGEGFGKMLN